MRRRLRTAIVVTTAVSVVLGISIPVASAHLRGHSDRYNRWRWYANQARHHRSTTTAAKPTSTTASTTTQPVRQNPTTTAPTTTTTTVPAPIPQPPSGGTSSGPPPAGGYFSVLPPGSALPSEADCAARVHLSSWEPRPENTTANHVTPAPNTLANFSQWNSTWNATYRPRINGNYHGTTDEIIQFYACKWGWSDELVRAEAVVESTWRQSTVGDNSTSYGLMQVRYLYHPNVNGTQCKACVGSSWPNSGNSTSWNVDQFLGEMRGCYDGMSTYLGNTRGDIWGCIGQWYSGAWHDGSAQTYIGWVQNALNNKAWRSWAG